MAVIQPLGEPKMALAAAGQVYLWTKPTTPPPPSGNLALYFRYAPHLYSFMLFLLGVK